MIIFYHFESIPIIFGCFLNFLIFLRMIMQIDFQLFGLLQYPSNFINFVNNYGKENHQMQPM